MSPAATANQTSAGGVVFRQMDGRAEVALILVGSQGRWQLPKGSINKDESIEAAALREVREETGLTSEIIDLLETIEYWFSARRGSQPVRFHKFVHFYLMRFIDGDVADHDHEVEEARWFEIDEAVEMLAFESEKAVVRKAKERIAE